MEVINKRIYFRADGSYKTGFGHVFRLLALVEMLKDEYECVFVTRNPEPFLRDIFYELKIAFIELPFFNYPSTYDRKKFDEVEFDMEDILKGDEVVVLDGYWFGEKYQKRIKEFGSKLVCIDDLVEAIFSADVVINLAPGISREEYNIPSTTKLYMGLDYALLRDDFLSVNKDVEVSKNDALFISFGGSDQFDFTQRTLNNVADMINWKEISVVLGSGYKNYETLVQKFKSYKHIKFYQGVSSEKIRALMVDSDIAILPSSNMLVEALACKLYVISGMTAQNQSRLYNYVSSNKIVYGIGNFNELDWGTFNWTKIYQEKEMIMRNNIVDGEKIKANYRAIFSDIFTSLK